MPSQQRLVFAGTPEFAATALRALIEAGHAIVAVYTQPDRPAGRGRRLQPGPVKQLALEHGIPVCQPEHFKSDAALAELAAWQADRMIVAAYGLLLPQQVLDIPAHGCLNIHASLLPRWRGAAPIQRAILAGDRETGVTIMQMDAGLDTGDMLLKLPCPIAPDETGGSLHDKLAVLGGKAIVQALANLEQLRPEPQDDAQATYARKLDKAEARIDWHKPAARLAREVHAFNPWPVSHTRLEGEPLRIWQAEAQEMSGDDSDQVPGTVVSTDSDGIDVACGQGLLRLQQIQPAGSKAMSAAAFLNGRPGRLQVGMRLGDDGGEAS
ncbi:methionyl-tRNA formyltransferase [Thiohalophilus thiocyanatoxydans]|uniref:Methionyl-tRNA formyltransferase n=1 Tax=Thiohalophilus thiocyanatoxydans TaxID=381308 RepID=A0A4R8J087_9GAMM|nr:methionyl-tRNA formyltransferase [Thiohalophilus thiocyanatoxydans]TDY03697.1 methionyl-tRNA formyltransferase [Thiohalophilus thiocyanatoxydans]